MDRSASATQKVGASEVVKSAAQEAGAIGKEVNSKQAKLAESLSEAIKDITNDNPTMFDYARSCASKQV